MFGSTFAGSPGSNSDAIGAALNGGKVPAGSTYYAMPFASALNPAAWISPWMKAGRVSKLVLSTANAQPLSGALIITVTKNAIPTALTITIPAGGPAAFYNNAVNFFDIVYGDFLGWNFQNTALAASAVLVGVAMQIEY